MGKLLLLDSSFSDRLWEETTRERSNRQARKRSGERVSTHNKLGSTTRKFDINESWLLVVVQIVLNDTYTLAFTNP